jgi:uncharacterized membrane protein
MRAFQRNKVLKVMYWRVLSFIVAGLISWAYLGELRSSLELTIILTVVMTVVHYYFEIAWEKHERRNIGKDNAP